MQWDFNMDKAISYNRNEYLWLDNVPLACVFNDQMSAEGMIYKYNHNMDFFFYHLYILESTHTPLHTQLRMGSSVLHKLFMAPVRKPIMRIRQATDNFNMFVNILPVWSVILPDSDCGTGG